MTELDWTILAFIAAIAAAFYAGMIYGERRLIDTMIDMLDPEEREAIAGMAEKIRADLDSKGIKAKVHSVDEADVIEIKHEIADGVHFFYRDDSTFLCQGDSLEAASKRFTELHGVNKVGVITTSTGGNALIIEGELRGGAEVK